MDFDLAQLRALAAVVELGSFDAAAGELHVSPSAVSQRIRALEVATHRIVVVRTRPVTVTPAGEPLLRLARQVASLSQDTAHELRLVGGSRLPLAVNADSLSTWVLPALAPLAGEIAFEFHREDQERTLDLLRDGTVMAAITSDDRAVQGCTVTRLGVMRYRPYASRPAAARWFSHGVTPDALAVAPMIEFDSDDGLQRRFLHERAPGAQPPRHQVPGAGDFAEAVRLGFGWGMLPELQALPLGDDVVLLDSDGGVDVGLYWQQWGVHTSSLDAAATAIAAAARRLR
jgi:LysR family transcriptional regulator (chromosome initiation inhibitor)